MSRVIISRHEDGSEKVVLGFDPPMESYFAHEYAPLEAEHPGELLRGVGDIGGVYSIDALVSETAHAGFLIPWTLALKNALLVRTPNAIIDLTCTCEPHAEPPTAGRNPRCPQHGD